MIEVLDQIEYCDFRRDAIYCATETIGLEDGVPFYSYCSFGVDY